MTAIDQSTPRNFPAVASVATLAYEGILLKKSSGANTVEIQTGTDTCFGILDQAFLDDEGNARTTASGDKVGVFQLGTGAIVNVRSSASQTYTIGIAVYASATDGAVDDSDPGSSNMIGHYAGDGEVTTATAGDLIPVCLDMPPGATGA